jgi:hypothetical protein
VAAREQCGVTDPDYEVEFREAIAGMIPSLIKLLEDKDKCVRSTAFELIGKLANHGELC